MCFKKNTNNEGNIEGNTNMGNEGGEPIDLEKREIKVRKDSEKVIKKEKSYEQIRKEKRIKAYVIIFLLIVAAVCYFTFMNLYLVDEKNKCERAKTNKLTLVDVLVCDDNAIKAQYVVNGKNTTCTVKFDDPITCNIQTKHKFIYISEDGYHCSSYEDSINCMYDINTFNGISGSIGVILFILLLWLVWESIANNCCDS